MLQSCLHWFLSDFIRAMMQQNAKTPLHSFILEHLAAAQAEVVRKVRRTRKQEMLSAAVQSEGTPNCMYVCHAVKLLFTACSGSERRQQSRFDFIASCLSVLPGHERCVTPPAGVQSQTLDPTHQSLICFTVKCGRALMLIVSGDRRPFKRDGQRETSPTVKPRHVGHQYSS